MVVEVYVVVEEYGDRKFKEPVMEERPVMWKAKIPKSTASDE